MCISLWGVPVGVDVLGTPDLNQPLSLIVEIYYKNIFALFGINFIW